MSLIPTGAEFVHSVADFLASAAGYTIGFAAGGYIGGYRGPAGAVAGATWGGRIGAKIAPDIIEAIALAIHGSSGPYLSPAIERATPTPGSVRYGPVSGLGLLQAIASADDMIADHDAIPYY